MKNGNKAFWVLIAWLVAGLGVIWGFLATPAGGDSDAGEHPGGGHGDGAAAIQPTWTERGGTNDRIRYLTELGVFPCATRCHNLLIPNPVRREGPIPQHEHVVLNHGEVIWCLNCHSEQNRDMLRLLDGTEVSFNETHRLCGQCHGPVYRDWLNGAHGERTGHWNGVKNAWPCVRCHAPHDPAFKPMRPRPPPRTRFEPAPDPDPDPDH